MRANNYTVINVLEITFQKNDTHTSDRKQNISLFDSWNSWLCYAIPAHQHVPMT